MAERHPGWVSGIDDFEARLASGFGVVSRSTGDALDPVRVRSGIKDSGGVPGRVGLSTNTKALVNPFQAVITNVAKPADGPYIVTLDSIKELTLDAASQTLHRIDVIYAEINTTSTAGFEVKVVKGLDATDPVKPTIANPLHLVLAEIRIPAGGAAPAVTDRRRFTAMAGGILPVVSAEDRPAGSPMSMFTYRLDIGVLEVQKTGVGWTPYRPPRADDWQAPKLLNGWVNYGGSFSPAGYTRNSDGWVLLRGLIKAGATTDLTSLFSLPDGYRPKSVLIFHAPAAYAKVVRVDVELSGNVRFATNNDATGGVITNQWLSLDGITFATY